MQFDQKQDKKTPSSMDNSKIVNKRLAESFKIEYEITTDDVQAVLQKHQEFYKSISTFDFNIFEFTHAVGRNMQMPAIATALLELNGLTSKVDSKKFL